MTKAMMRRCGYAANLVHAITLQIKELGLLPILYNDADYVASDVCYESIGYRLRGDCVQWGRNAYNNKRLDVQKIVRYNKSTENCT